MDLDDFDIYGDLESFDINEKLKEKNEELKVIQENYNAALKQIEKLEIERQEHMKKVENMERSFSSLLATARTELKRKEMQIYELRTEKDNICFRRNNRGNKHLEDGGINNVRRDENNDAAIINKVRNPFSEQRISREKTNPITSSPSTNGHYRADYSKSREHEDREKDHWRKSKEHEICKRENERKQYRSQERRTERRDTDSMDSTNKNHELLGTINPRLKSTISRSRDRNRSDERKYSNYDKRCDKLKKEEISSRTSYTYEILKDRSRQDEDKNSRNLRKYDNHESSSNLHNSEKPQWKSQDEGSKKRSYKEKEKSHPVERDIIEKSQSRGREIEKSHSRGIEMEKNQPKRQKPSTDSLCISVSESKIRKVSFEENKMSSNSPEKSVQSQKVERRITLSEYRYRKGVPYVEESSDESSIKSHKEESHKKIELLKKHRNSPEVAMNLLISIKSDSIVLKDKEHHESRPDKTEALDAIKSTEIHDEKINVVVNTSSAKSQEIHDEKNNVVVNTSLDKSPEIVGQSLKSEIIGEKKANLSFQDIPIDEIVSEDNFKKNVKSNQENENLVSDISEDERLYIDLEGPNESPMQTNNLNDSKQTRNTGTTENYVETRSLEEVEMSIEENKKKSHVDAGNPKQIETIIEERKNRSHVETGSPKEVEIPIEKNINEILNEDIQKEFTREEINRIDDEHPLSDANENMKESEQVHPQLQSLKDPCKINEVRPSEEEDIPLTNDLNDNDNAERNNNEKNFSDELNVGCKLNDIENLSTDNIPKDHEIEQETEKQFSFTPTLTGKYFGDQNKDANVTPELNDSLTRKFDCIESQLEYIFRDTSNKSLEAKTPNSSRNDSELQSTPKNSKTKAQEMFDLYLASPTYIIPSEIENHTNTKEKTPPGQMISGTKKRKSSTPRKSSAVNARGMKLIGHRIEGFEPGIHGVKALEASKLKNALFKEALCSEDVVKESLQEAVNALFADSTTSSLEIRNDDSDLKDSNSSQKNFKLEERMQECGPDLTSFENSCETCIANDRDGGSDKTGTGFESKEVLNFNDRNNAKELELTQTSEEGDKVLLEDEDNEEVEAQHKDNLESQENKETEDGENIEEDFNRDKLKVAASKEIDEENKDTIAIGKENCEPEKDLADKTLSDEKLKDSPKEIDAKMECSKPLEDHVGFTLSSTGSCSMDTVVNCSTTKDRSDLSDDNSEIKGNLSSSPRNLSEIQTSFESEQNIDEDLSPSKSPIKEKIEILSIVTIKSDADKLVVISSNPQQHADKDSGQCVNGEKSKNNYSNEKCFTLSNSANVHSDVDHDLIKMNVSLTADQDKNARKSYFNKDSDSVKILTTTTTPKSDNATFSHDDNNKQNVKNFKEPLAPDELFEINASQNSRQYCSDISSPEGFSHSPREMTTRIHIQNRPNTSPRNPFVKLDLMGTHNTFGQSYSAENLKRTKEKGIKKFVEDFCRSIESVDEETVSDSINSYMSDHEVAPVSSIGKSKESCFNFGTAIKLSGDGDLLKSKSMKTFDSHFEDPLSRKENKHEKLQSESEQISKSCPKLEDQKDIKPSSIKDKKLSTRKRINKKRKATDTISRTTKTKRPKLHDQCSKSNLEKTSSTTTHQENDESQPRPPSVPEISQEIETAIAVKSILVEESNEDECQTLPSLTKENIQKMHKCLTECENLPATHRSRGRLRKNSDKHKRRNSRTEIHLQKSSIDDDSEQIHSAIVPAVRKSSRIHERIINGRYGLSKCECCHENVSIKSDEISVEEHLFDIPCEEKHSQHTVQSKFIELFGNSPVPSPTKENITKKHDNYTINREKKESEEKNPIEEHLPVDNESRGGGEIGGGEDINSNKNSRLQLKSDSIQEDRTTFTQQNTQNNEGEEEEVQHGGLSLHPSDSLSHSEQPNDQNTTGQDETSLKNKDNIRTNKRRFPEENSPGEDKINNTTIFNDSGGERRNISTASTDYIFETVSSSVVNVFITRKKRRRKMAT